MSAKKLFGVPKNANVLNFDAQYNGPIGILNPSKARVELAAVHQSGEATLGLVQSVQSLIVDTEVFPHRIEGAASFYTEDGENVLLSKFTGMSTPKDGQQGVEEAVVFVNFTGGTGRFEGACGQAQVEADLHLSEGFSKGTLHGNVIVPKYEG